jgi:poly(A) polymerase
MSLSKRRIVMTGALAEPGLHRILKVLAYDGDRTLIVGGAVRNALIGYPIIDVDLATTALPEVVIERVTEAGMRAIPTGIAHGTVTVLVDDHSYEVTTLREDIQTDGRHAKVVFGTDFTRDAARRDFTINALYADSEGAVYDFVGGLDDILYRRVRFIGKPSERIREDYLRILRFFRFSADYANGILDANGLKAVEDEKSGLQQLSAERIRAEVFKVLMARKAVPVLTSMNHRGIFDLILGLPVSVEALEALLVQDPGADSLLRLAVLCLHRPDDGALLKERLRLSNAEADRLTELGQALTRLSGFARPIGVLPIRKLAFRLGRRTVLEALGIDAARRGYLIAPELFAAIGSAPTVSPFTGDILIKRGIEPGRQMGDIIRRAEELWMDSDFPGAPERLNAILNDTMAYLS